jgi:hypothetical protein
MVHVFGVITLQPGTKISGSAWARIAMRWRSPCETRYLFFFVTYKKINFK